MNIFTDKKGDLSLSVNAIVVLVIAIIFLGLAIGFTTKLIGNSKDKLLSGVDNVDISTPANSENQMVFDGKLEVKTNSKVPIKISYYNNEGNTLTASKPYIQECITDSGASLSPLNFTALPVDVTAYKEQRYQAMLVSTSAATVGNYICIVKMRGSTAFSKQVAIAVTS
jgi:hypothetical protein